MKIEHISLDNLNSLGGHVELDLTHPSLADGGIFVICGPTGSGKTTLLDAITYALYGQTARQGRLTASSNEIMTHGTRWCRAEVRVEKDGVRYLFSTEQRRKKTRSANADPYTTAERRASRLEADGSATLLSADVNGVRLVAEGLMKYENFCRCMMLAQGEFARFLKADARERSEALATITGTGIYQRIGERVQEQVAGLRARLAAVALLPTKDAPGRAEVEHRRDEQAARCHALQTQLEQLHAELAGHDALARAQATCNSRQELLAQARAARSQFEAAGTPGRIRAAESALAIRAQELPCTSARRELQDTQARLRTEQEWLRAHPGSELRRAAQEAVAALEEQQPQLRQHLLFLAGQVQPLEDAIGKAEIEERAAAQAATSRQREAEAATAMASQAAEACQQARQAEEAAQRALAALPPLQEAEQACAAAQQRAELAYKIQSVSGKLEELYREFCQGRLSCCPCCGSPTPHQHPQQHAGELAQAQQEARQLAEALRSLQRDTENARARQAATHAAREAAQRAEAAARAEAGRQARLLSTARSTAEEARQVLGALRQQLSSIWQGGSAREAGELTRHTLTRLQEASRQSQEALQRFLTQREAHAALAQAAAERLPQLEQELARADAAFCAALREHAFADEEAYRAALLPADTLQHLRQEDARLIQNLAAAQGAFEQAGQQVSSLRARIRSEASRESLEEQKRGLAQLLHEQKELLTATLAELRQDDDAHAANARQETQLAGTRAELAQWQRLYEILGNTRDGFKKYAQRITFNLLLRQANKRLRELTERYLLVQDERGELELRVIDRYQDDEKGRACSNLSGGESFMVSLALALGLASMAGETRIDTLFLDEGFGTLDEQALEQVLACLQNLRAGGKLIGIISHVEALKERIPARLELVPRGATGLSTLAPHAAVVAEVK